MSDYKNCLPVPNLTLESMKMVYKYCYNLSRVPPGYIKYGEL